jgi:hypothetical protein
MSKNPLQLVLVEVDGEDALGAGGRHHVGHQLGADGHARLVLAVLPGVAEVGDDGGDALGRGAPRGVDQEEQLHDVVAGRHGALHDVQVAPAHVLVDAHEDLAVGEAADGDRPQRDPQLGAHLLGQGAVGGAGQQHQLGEVAGIRVVEGGHRSGPEIGALRS